MPIPKPRANESKDDFTSRCMGDDTMNSEYPDNKQRFAICMNSWKSKKNYTRNILSSLETEKGDWVIVAYAATCDVNNNGVQITRQALENAQKDFETYATVLFNHNRDMAIGHVVATEVDDKGLKLTIIISKTCEDIWKKIQDKTISKMSIYGEYNYGEDATELPNLGIIQINKIKFYEASVVTVPGDGAADIEESYVASKTINNSEVMSGLRDKLKEIASMDPDAAKCAIDKLVEEFEAEEKMDTLLLDNMRVIAGKLTGDDISLMEGIIARVEAMLKKKKCKSDDGSDDDDSGMPELDLSDESETRPVVILADKSEITEQGKNLFRKQILKIGKWYHNSAPGGVLNITKELISNLVSNFNAGIIENVFVPLKHTDDPAKNTGNVVQLIQTDNGLDAILEIKDEGVAEKIKKDLIRCISASFDSNYFVKTSGKYVGPTLLHAALVGEPYLKGMDKFIPLADEFAGRPVYSFEDAIEEKSIESDDSNVQETEIQKNDMNLNDQKEAVVDTTEETVEEAVVETEPKTDEAVVEETATETPAVEAETKEETETADEAVEETAEEVVEEQTEEDVDLSDVSGAYESLLKAGKVVPAQKDAFMSLFGSSKKSISLADGSPISLSDAITKFFELQPTIVDFSEDGVSPDGAEPAKADPEEMSPEVAEFFKDKMNLDDEGAKIAWNTLQEMKKAENDNKSTLF